MTAMISPPPLFLVMSCAVCVCGWPSEMARLFGIEFFAVINRGSQFRVESMMMRLACPSEFLLLSPSREQVMQQDAIECIPLVLEPVLKLLSVLLFCCWVSPCRLYPKCNHALSLSLWPAPEIRHVHRSCGRVGFSVTVPLGHYCL